MFDVVQRDIDMLVCSPTRDERRRLANRAYVANANGTSGATFAPDARSGLTREERDRLRYV